jgi:hypothetical protein
VSHALLDINVLLALVDPHHVDHERAHAWAADGLGQGWATCALTQIGFVRILSQPSYPHPVPVDQAVSLLAEATSLQGHTLWTCDLPLTDDHFRPRHLLGHRQLTDTYLLGLAVRQRGTFVTLDRRVDLQTVTGAGAEHLTVV